jgi:hypothetical protein
MTSDEHARARVLTAIERTQRGGGYVAERVRGGHNFWQST